MEVTSSPLSHRFVVAQDICTLFVELPFLSSFEGVEVDVGSESVRIGLPGEAVPRHIPWPAEAKGKQDVDSSSARFSRKSAQLIVKLPLRELDSGAIGAEKEKCPAAESDILLPPSKDTVSAQTSGPQLREEKAQVDNVTEKKLATQTPSQQLTEQKVQGSGWNANSWHWEERPMIKWSQSWFEEELNGTSLPILGDLAALRFLDTSEVLKGEISLMVRKGRPVVLYDLTAVWRWEAVGRPGDHTRGKIWIKDFNADDGAAEGVDAAKIEIDVNIDTSQGRRVSKAVKEDLMRHMRLFLKRFLEALVSQAAAPKA